MRKIRDRLVISMSFSKIWNVSKSKFKIKEHFERADYSNLQGNIVYSLYKITELSSTAKFSTNRTFQMSPCFTLGCTSTSMGMTRRRSSLSLRRARGGRWATRDTPPSTASGTRSGWLDCWASIQCHFPSRALFRMHFGALFGALSFRRHFHIVNLTLISFISLFTCTVRWVLRVNNGKPLQSPNNLARTGSARTRLVLQLPRPYDLLHQSGFLRI